MIGRFVGGSAGLLGSLAILVAGGLTSLPVPSSPSSAAVASIPADYLVLYQQAALSCPGLDWTVLAAVGAVESDHGRSTLPGVQSGANSAGAQGPMQFLPGTFAFYAPPESPPATASPFDPADAILAAARYLCASGVADDVSPALVTYNCGNPGPGCQIAAASYAARVLAVASGYRAIDDQPGVGALIAVDAAMAMRGTPYVWGGEDPSGFDCSGLSQWAYAHAGIALPRTAQLQYEAGPRRPPGARLQPGDLIFFGRSATAITHMGIYVGDGLMVDAPHTGAVVRLDPIARFSPPYIGATAPGNAA